MKMSLTPRLNPRPNSTPGLALQEKIIRAKVEEMERELHKHIQNDAQELERQRQHKLGAASKVTRVTA